MLNSKRQELPATSPCGSGLSKVSGMAVMKQIEFETADAFYQVMGGLEKAGYAPGTIQYAYPNGRRGVIGYDPSSAHVTHLLRRMFVLTDGMNNHG